MTRVPGRRTLHSFSFGEFYDAERIGFGPITAVNDDLLATDVGYDAHAHADVLLVTWVVSGDLRHQDATGTSDLAAGSLAVTSAGTGIVHSEHATGGPARFVQTWLTPDHPGGEPSRDIITPDLSSGELVPVTGVGSPLALEVAGATLLIAALPAGAITTLPSAPLVDVFVVTGALTRSSMAEPLSAGDAFEISDESGLPVTAAVPTTLLVWTFGT